SRILIASIYHNNREFDLAEPLLIKNRLELKSIEPSTLKDSLLIDTYGAFAEFYYCEEDYPNSVKNYIQSLKISKK
ncbi:hypothetical protein, partial [Psychroflexus sp. MES1-P1E]|uniref:hypothetical protein n=1 Tax=Psychroflexus sp. MES1-P1E TaxID=2058320 RepID=UPI000CC4E696